MSRSSQFTARYLRVFNVTLLDVNSTYDQSNLVPLKRQFNGGTSQTFEWQPWNADNTSFYVDFGGAMSFGPLSFLTAGNKMKTATIELSTDFEGKHVVWSRAVNKGMYNNAPHELHHTNCTILACIPPA